VVQLDVSNKEDWMKVKEYIQAHLPATASGKKARKSKRENPGSTSLLPQVGTGKKD
jgi:hypothetical protein